MSTILYGNLRAEIVGDAGVRLSLLAQRQPASGLLRPGQHDQSAEPLGFRWGSWTEQGQELRFAGACQ